MEMLQSYFAKQVCNAEVFCKTHAGCEFLANNFSLKIDRIFIYFHRKWDYALEYLSHCPRHCILI